MWWICDGAPKATSHEARTVLGTTVYGSEARNSALADQASAGGFVRGQPWPTTPKVDQPRLVEDHSGMVAQARMATAFCTSVSEGTCPSRVERWAMSFHLGLLGLSGAWWLNDPPDVS